MPRAKDNGDNNKSLWFWQFEAALKKRFVDHDSLIADALAFVGEFAGAAGLTSSPQNKLALIVEELVTNIVNHGELGPEGFVELELVTGNMGIEVDVLDSGTAFDPISDAPEDDRHKPVEERRIGGLGWPLIREMSTDLVYERMDNTNRLRFRLILS